MARSVFSPYQPGNLFGYLRDALATPGTYEPTRGRFAGFGGRGEPTGRRSTTAPFRLGAVFVAFGLAAFSLFGAALGFTLEGSFARRYSLSAGRVLLAFMPLLA